MRTSQRTRNYGGFSLLEVLIVVLVILVITTIAIPGFLRARQSANESSAIANLRSLHTAQIAYGHGNAGVFGTVDDLISDGLVDARYLALRSGYAFDINLSDDAEDFMMTATASPNQGRYDYFSIPEDHVIRYSTSADRAPSGLAGEPVQ